MTTQSLAGRDHRPGKRRLRLRCLHFLLPARAYRLSAPAATCAWLSLRLNRSLVAHYAAWPARPASAARSASYRTHTVDPLCRAFLTASGLHPSQIQGYGLGVIHARACYYAKRIRALPIICKKAAPLGPTGRAMVIADRLDGYDDALSRRLTDLVVHANVAVRDLGYKPYIAPALSSAALSIILTLRGQWALRVGLPRRCIEGAFFGVKNCVAGGCVTYEDVCACRPPMRAGNGLIRH